MSNGISPKPEVPYEIKEAVNKDTLAVFIGAGVSRLVGCQGWDTLAKNLMNACCEEKIITHEEYKTLSKNPDHRKTITICNHLFKNKDRESLFYLEMKKSLKEKDVIERSEDNVKVPNIYDDIINLRGLFITTNADTHFDRFFERQNILYKVSDFQEDRLERTNLYHIHGSIIEKNSLVFTLPQYIKRYIEPSFRAFLSRIFQDYNVLFLGYGLSEFEILEFLVRRISGNKRHFMLRAFLKEEDNILNYEQSYYNDLNINIIPYEKKDDKGYSQLIEVVKEWNKEINQVTSYLHDTSRLIDEAVR